MTTGEARGLTAAIIVVAAVAAVTAWRGGAFSSTKEPTAVNEISISACERCPNEAVALSDSAVVAERAEVKVRDKRKRVKSKPSDARGVGKRRSFLDEPVDEPGH